MGTMASQITSLTIVYSAVYLGAGKKNKKHQSSASLAFVRKIHREPMNSPHKWPVRRKMLPFDDVIMTPIKIYTEKSERLYRPTRVREIFITQLSRYFQCQLRKHNFLCLWFIVHFWSRNSRRVQQVIKQLNHQNNVSIDTMVLCKTDANKSGSVTPQYFWYAPTGVRHLVCCRWPGAKWAPSRQQPPCCLDYDRW